MGCVRDVVETLTLDDVPVSAMLMGSLMASAYGDPMLGVIKTAGPGAVWQLSSYDHLGSRARLSTCSCRIAWTCVQSVQP